MRGILAQVGAIPWERFGSSPRVRGILNRISLTRFGSLKELVNYATAQAHTPARPHRLAWAEALVAALKRHHNPGAREKLYWKVALT